MEYEYEMNHGKPWRKREGEGRREKKEESE
jgi:hypothetical protein